MREYVCILQVCLFICVFFVCFSVCMQMYVDVCVHMDFSVYNVDVCVYVLVSV